MVSQKLLPWIAAISSSSFDGDLEPSASANVAAPHGLPVHSLETSSLQTGYTLTTTNLRNVVQPRHRLGVSKRDEDDTMVGECADGFDDGGLFSSPRYGSGNEYTGVFASEGSGGPKSDSGSPEGFPLSGGTTIMGGYTKEEGVEVFKFVDGHHWVIGLGRCMHFLEDFRRESLGNSNHDLIRSNRQGIRGTN